MKRIAIIVGHSSAKPGSKNYLEETEYIFNKRIAINLKEELDTGFYCRTRVFFRDGTTTTGVGDMVENWRADASVELHCNSFKEPIEHGKVCEALALDKDIQSINFARLFCKLMEDNFHFGLRGVSGCKNIRYGERGSINLASINLDIPKILVEPCFTNFKTKEAELFLKNEELYVNILTTSFAHLLDLNKVEQFNNDEEVYSKDYIADFVNAMKDIRDQCNNFINKWDE